MWIDRGQITGYKLNKSKLIDDSRMFNVLPSIMAILKKRKVANIESYLGTSYMYYNPRDLFNAERGAELIENAIADNELITIIGDYDVDGIFSSSLLKHAIESCNGKAEILIPDRNIDGYGISNRLIDIAYDNGSHTIITVDNGIAAHNQIAYAKSLGFTVILTDHHDFPFTEVDGKAEYILPDADIIINPKYPGHNYSFADICGTMVAYKIAQILVDDLISDVDIKDYLVMRYKEMTGIATVADVMPLIDENRYIVKETLNLIKSGSSIPGIRALMDICGVEPSHISAFSIGFVIGPCINAEGRVKGNVKDALTLLSCEDEQIAHNMAVVLKELNEERKSNCLYAEELAEDILKKSNFLSNNILMLYIPDIMESICGIVAGRIKERYMKPCIVVTNTSSGLLKGSGRSIEGYNMFEHLNAHRDMFEKMGGHPLAAGLSISEDNFYTLRDILNEESYLLEQSLFGCQIKAVDLYMPMANVSDRFISELSLLEPFGQGNDKPVLCSENLKLYGLKTVGSKNNAVRLYLWENGKKIEGIYFGNISQFNDKLTELLGAKVVEELYTNSLHSVSVDCIYYPSFNIWNNITSIQYIISDLQISNN